MENINQDQPICGFCGKTMQPLSSRLESRIISSHNEKKGPFENFDGLSFEDFDGDQHLQCRIRCAKYFVVGLRGRWLAPEKFIVTSTNKTPYDLINSLKEMTTEQLKYRGLYLYGQPGTGKTHLLSIFCSRLIDRGVSLTNIRWINTSSMLTEMRASIGKKYEEGETTEQEKILDDLRKRYLFIDDLGTESSSEWAKEILYNTINYRYEEQLPTFISSNLSLKELAERLGDKFASRVIEMCKLVKISGEDWRLKKSDAENINSEAQKIEVPLFSYQMASWQI
ncbi:MAG: ATP-binding protein [Candidatus Paceibacterota bacterium]|jgi:DNA replication protein DnaC